MLDRFLQKREYIQFFRLILADGSYEHSLFSVKVLGCKNESLTIWTFDR